jgi:hypothetical protein
MAITELYNAELFVKTGGTYGYHQGQIKGRASRAAARGANLERALKHHFLIIKEQIFEENRFEGALNY